VPASLDINALTYSREQFYSDITSYYRAITPVYTLPQMVATDSGDLSLQSGCVNPQCSSPLGFLTNALLMVVESPSKVSITEYEYQIKMFCAIFKSACRERYAQLKVLYNSHQNSLVAGSGIDDFGKEVFAVLESYGALGKFLKGKIDDKLYDYYTFGEEFMINLAQMYAHKLNGFVTESQSLNDSGANREIAESSEVEKNGENTHLLKKMILRLGSYKKERGYGLLEENQDTHNANLLYRWSVLKKYVESDLFLSVDKRKSGVIAEQVYYSIAAGLSMVFATAVAFTFQQKYGNFTMPLFVALVVSYMLKDRIKELIRSAFASNRKLKYFDNKTILGVKDTVIGNSREGFDFLPQTKVPEHILEIRNRSIIVDVENRMNQESILFYRNLIVLDRKKLESTSEYEIDGINKILLFNFSSFIKKMDNPQVLYPFVKPAGSQIDTVSVNKIYYINFIFQFTCKGEVSYYRYRVTMNRDGILGLEELAAE
ncbi:MAG: hypothetical protein IKD16_02635, partial [Bacteroidales bacterium]|nr:hypothetical protein [Bacteroidales bacterium]